MSVSIVNEIIVSMQTCPEDWQWNLSACENQKEGWESSTRGNTERTRFVERLNEWQRYHDGVDMYLVHRTGIVIYNPTKYDDNDWQLIKPEHHKLGWWARRKLRKAVKKLRLAKFQHTLLS